jgi:hypothetical protein
MNKEELIIGFFEKGYCCDLDEVKDTCLGLLKENQELQKHLEEKTKIGIADHKYASKCEDKVVVMEAQQQKFTKYLEDELKRINPNELTVRELVDSELDNVEFTQYLTYKDVFQKYKEIMNRSEQF